MDPPLFGAEFIRRRQKRRKKARLSKTPSQPARDKGCGTQSPDTHNAACGIETNSHSSNHTCQRCPDTHNAACGIETTIMRSNTCRTICPDTHNAACGIETRVNLTQGAIVLCPDTHNAACGIETSDHLCGYLIPIGVPTHTMLRAALKHIDDDVTRDFVGPDTHNAACGIETTEPRTRQPTLPQSRHTQCCVRH